MRIRLAPKGKEVHEIVAGIYEKHIRTVEQIGGISTGPGCEAGPVRL